MNVDFMNLEQLQSGKSYTYASDAGIEGSFEVLKQDVQPRVLFNVMEANDEPGHITVGVHCIALIGWILDTDDFIKSLCLNQFSSPERFDFGSSNLLGLLLSGSYLAPRPILLGTNPEIEDTLSPEPAQERHDW